MLWNLVRQRIKRAWLRLLGHSTRHLQPRVKLPTRWYGARGAGAFLYPDILGRESVVYSVGIGESVAFDVDMIRLHGCIVHGFDPTPRSIAWVQRQQLPEQFRLHTYGLGAQTAEVDFFLPVNDQYVSGSATAHVNVNAHDRVRVLLKSIVDIARELGHTKIDVLKIDIEGTEYEVIDSLLDSGIPFVQLLIEFHERFFPDGKARTERALESLRRHGFEIFARAEQGRQVSFIRLPLR